MATIRQLQRSPVTAQNPLLRAPLTLPLTDTGDASGEPLLLTKVDHFELLSLEDALSTSPLDGESVHSEFRTGVWKMH